MGKQGIANVRQGLADAFGPDSGPMLGAIGAIVGAIALVGVAVNNNNVNSLSKDQDSICTTAKALGNTALTLSDASSSSQFTGGSTGTAAKNSEIQARLNL